METEERRLREEIESYSIGGTDMLTTATDSRRGTDRELPLSALLHSTPSTQRNASSTLPLSTPIPPSLNYTPSPSQLDQTIPSTFRSQPSDYNSPHTLLPQYEQGSDATFRANLSRESSEATPSRLLSKYDTIRGTTFNDEAAIKQARIDDSEKKQKKYIDGLLRKQLEMEMKEKKDKDKIKNELELWMGVLHAYRLPTTDTSEGVLAKGSKGGTYALSNFESDGYTGNPRDVFPFKASNISCRDHFLRDQRNVSGIALLGKNSCRSEGRGEGASFFVPPSPNAQRRKNALPDIVVLSSEGEMQKEVRITALLRILSIKWVRLGLIILDDFRTLKDQEERGVLDSAQSGLLSVLTGLHTCARATCMNVKKKSDPFQPENNFQESGINESSKSFHEQKNPKWSKEEKESSAANISDQALAFALVFSLGLVHRLTASSGSLLLPSSTGDVADERTRTETEVVHSQALVCTNTVLS